MTDETIRELCSEHDACIIRARELGDVEIRLRRERFALRGVDDPRLRIGRVNLTPAGGHPG